jgi:ADP-heptose:LPS heptosyltransferase
VISTVAIPTVLVLRALGLGDLLTAVPALRALRAHHPDHRMVLAAPVGLRPIVELTGAVDEVLPTAELGPLGWAGPSPRIAVNLHGRGPRSTHALRALAPGTLLTHAHPEHPGLPGAQWEPEVHEVHRWCRLLTSAGIPADPGDLALARPQVPSPAPGAVVVHPTAALPARRWPTDRFAEVARGLAGRGLRVVVTGSAAERDLAEQVAITAGLPRESVLAGRTDLPALAALVADASLVVCADTGVGHLATAYGTPSVVLFGPVAPSRWGPPPERPQHVTLWSGTTSDPFAAAPDPGLVQITAAAVRTAAEGLLSSTPGWRRCAPAGRAG